MSPTSGDVSRPTTRRPPQRAVSSAPMHLSPRSRLPPVAPPASRLSTPLPPVAPPASRPPAQSLSSTAHHQSPIKSEGGTINEAHPPQASNPPARSRPRHRGDACSCSASASSATAAPFCGIVWGSLAKSASRAGDPTITNARAGQHGCFDRLVIDFRGKGANATVRYVSQVLDQGRGAPIPPAAAPRSRSWSGVGRSTSKRVPSPITSATPASWSTRPASAPSVRSRGAAPFEGYTTFALGVRARLPFQVFTLDGPGSGSRLVIDVAHLW